MAYQAQQGASTSRLLAEPRRSAVSLTVATVMAMLYANDKLTAVSQIVAAGTAEQLPPVANSFEFDTGPSSDAGLANRWAQLSHEHDP